MTIIFNSCVLLLITFVSVDVHSYIIKIKLETMSNIRRKKFQKDKILLKFL